MPVPAHPKIYHIVHVDRLASIIADDYLWSDAMMNQRPSGTVIGIESIKQRAAAFQSAATTGCALGIACRSIFVRDR